MRHTPKARVVIVTGGLRCGSTKLFNLLKALLPDPEVALKDKQISINTLVADHESAKPLLIKRHFEMPATVTPDVYGLVPVRDPGDIACSMLRYGKLNPYKKKWQDPNLILTDVATQLHWERQLLIRPDVTAVLYEELMHYCLSTMSGILDYIGHPADDDAIAGACAAEDPRKIQEICAGIEPGRTDYWTNRHYGHISRGLGESVTLDSEEAALREMVDNTFGKPRILHEQAW